MVSPMVQDSRAVSLRAPVDSRNRAWPCGISRRGATGADDDPSSLVGHRVFAHLRTRNHYRNDADYRGDRASVYLYDEALRAIKSRTGDSVRNAERGFRIFLVLPNRIR